MTHRVKALLPHAAIKTFVAATLGTCLLSNAAHADLPSTNHASHGVTSIAQLNELLSDTEIRISSRRQQEQIVFQQLQSQLAQKGWINPVAIKELPESPQPESQSFILNIFKRYLATQNIENLPLEEMTQLRDLLRRLQQLDQGHLSGAVWLYDSTLASSTQKYLNTVDRKILQKSLNSAASLREKHHYAAAQKIYKSLLADYADTDHSEPIKVLLTAAIVEDYNYRAKIAFAKHDYKKGRAALKQIIALYPNTKYARDAQEAIDKSVSVSVQYFRSQADKAFHPQGNVGVPQSKARLYYSLMYESEPDGPQADYAYYRWCEALGTEGKINEALAKLKKFPLQFPHSKLLPKAYFLTGFLLGAAPSCQYEEACVWLEKVAQNYQKSQIVSEAIWYLAFFSDANGDTAAVKKWLQQLSRNYPKSPRVTAARQWLQNLK